MGQAPVPRKYPRADVDQPGVMTIRSAQDPLAQRVPVAIRSISPEGAGVALGDKRSALDRRTMVTMGFTAHGRRFEIPAQVAWISSGAPAQGSPDVGLRLQLALVPNEARLAYARWVVELLRQKAQSPR